MLFMGIDVGSSVCKASVMNETGQVRCFAAREYAFTYKDGRCELDAEMVWDSVLSAICELGKLGDLTELRTISVTSFGEMFVLLDEKKKKVERPFKSIQLIIQFFTQNSIPKYSKNQIINAVIQFIGLVI